ncbi:hypothetical protein [Paraburkholderia phosphatilytica]|uniref:hypothetical protein n=1 Tax=Paraburkholderia phosphatilytica TaxID=2282883 RepID=UPI001F0C8738|nr:hypothetical protein [Paraburkholderia phosphatilytica]
MKRMPYPLAMLMLAVPLLVVLLTARPAFAAELPKAIASQIPAGYQVMLWKAGLLDRSGADGYLVVAHRPDDSKETPSPRPLMIFVRNPDGTFRLAARNDHVVMRADAGGQCDPFADGVEDGQGLTVKDRYFTVENGEACGDHWTDYITFHYDDLHRDWLFHKEIVQSFSYDELVNGKPGKTTVTNADRARPVTFDAWRPAP